MTPRLYGGYLVWFSLSSSLFWEIRAGTKICDFLPLFQADLKNYPQEINDKKDIQFHGVVINNRLFNLIHLVQEKKFSLFSFNHVQGLQGL